LLGILSVGLTFARMRALPHAWKDGGGPHSSCANSRRNARYHAPPPPTHFGGSVCIVPPGVEVWRGKRGCPDYESRLITMSRGSQPIHLDSHLIAPGRSEHQTFPGTNSTFRSKPQVNSSTFGVGKDRISQLLARNSHFSQSERNAASLPSWPHAAVWPARVVKRALEPF